MLSREGGPLEFIQPPSNLADRKEFLNIKGKRYACKRPWRPIEL
jgi:hypothetical protein